MQGSGWQQYPTGHEIQLPRSRNDKRQEYCRRSTKTSQ